MQWLTVRVLPGTMEMPPQAEAVLSAGPTVIPPAVTPMQERVPTVCVMVAITWLVVRVM